MKFQALKKKRRVKVLILQIFEGRINKKNDEQKGKGKKNNGYQTTEFEQNMDVKGGGGIFECIMMEK